MRLSELTSVNVVRWCVWRITPENVQYNSPSSLHPNAMAVMGGGFCNIANQKREIVVLALIEVEFIRSRSYHYVCSNSNYCVEYHFGFP